MRDERQHEVERLVGMARRHAELALSQPAESRGEHLAACRSVWKRYAAALGAEDAERDAFAEALVQVTQEMMTVLHAMEAAPPSAEEASPVTPSSRDGGSGGEPEALRAWKQKPLTIEELRPTLRQIIGR